MSRIIICASTVEKPATATPPIVDGAIQAFRLPDGDTIADDHESFDCIAAVIVAHPELPWGSLSVFYGEPNDIPEMTE